MTHPQSSELRELVERFVADRDELLRFYDVGGSALQIRRMREFFTAWHKRLEEMPYDSLGTEGRVDWLLLERRLDYEQRLLDREDTREREMAPLVPFAADVANLQESRRLMVPVDPQAAAATLDRIQKQVSGIRDGLQAGLKGDSAEKDSKVAPLTTSRVIAFRSVAAIADLRDSLEDWYKFYGGYDPTFTWWVKASHDKLE